MVSLLLHLLTVMLCMHMHDNADLYSLFYANLYVLGRWIRVGRILIGTRYLLCVRVRVPHPLLPIPKAVHEIVPWVGCRTCLNLWYNLIQLLHTILSSSVTVWLSQSDTFIRGMQRGQRITRKKLLGLGHTDFQKIITATFTELIARLTTQYCKL